MSSEGNVFVNFEDDTFLLTEKPRLDCKAVVEERDKILSTVDLDQFNSRLVAVGKLIRIAYNGIAGDTELQITLRELWYEIAELSDDSVLAIRKFQMTADGILTDLMGAYQFFLEDMVEMAVVFTESIPDSAKSAVNAAQRLHDRFRIEAEMVQRVSEKAAKKRCMEGKVQKDLRRKEEDIMAEAEVQLCKSQNADKEELKIENEIAAATDEELRVSAELTSNMADLVLGALTLGIVPAYRLSRAAKAMDNVQGEIDYLHKRKRTVAEHQRKAVGKLEECCQQMAHCISKKAYIRMEAIPALRGASATLSCLAYTMQYTAIFMQEKFIDKVNRALDFLLNVSKLYQDSMKRRKAYLSKSVKVRMIELYVLLVAMEAVFNDCVKKIKVTREEIYKYLRENPTIEESVESVDLLCREFKGRLF